MDSVKHSPSTSSDEDSLNGVFDFNEIEDEELFQATRKVLETGKLTPIIKQELKFLIQSRRLSEGKDEIEINFEAKSRVNRELNEAELMKLARRRQQNAVAAKKFRKNMKNKKIKMKEELSNLMKSNQKLRRNVEKLENEKNELLRRFLKTLPVMGSRQSTEVAECNCCGDVD